MATVRNLSILFLFLTSPSIMKGQYTWAQSGGGNWSVAGNWSPAGPPNAANASVTFNNSASASNPAQTADRTITVDDFFRVNSITFNNNNLNSFNNTIGAMPGVAFPRNLIFLNSTGQYSINVPAAMGQGNNTITAPMDINSGTLALNVDQVTATSAAGALLITGHLTGGGGSVVKYGNGCATLDGAPLDYTGDTTINGGRLRIGIASSQLFAGHVTVNSGGQLSLFSSGSYSFGVVFNGSGPTSGPFSTTPGAIRSDPGLDVTLLAATLQSSTLIHVQATAGTGATNPVGSLTISGPVNGPGKLILTAPGSNIDQGTLILTSLNNYSGGTLISGGTLVSNLSNLGTGDVTVDNSAAPSAIARLRLIGISYHIHFDRTLSIKGGNGGMVFLDSGLSQRVGGLILGGVVQTQAGTYGSTASSATFQNDMYFSGTGVVNFVPVPEPAAATAVIVAGLGLATAARRRHRK
jgi:autotransporter-associated beta strand protein